MFMFTVCVYGRMTINTGLSLFFSNVYGYNLKFLGTFCLKLCGSSWSLKVS